MGLRLLAMMLGAAFTASLLRRCAGNFVRSAGPAMTGLSVVGLLVVAVGAMHGMRAQVLDWRDVVSALGLAFALNLGFHALGAALFARWGGCCAPTVGLISGNRNVTLVWVAPMPWLRHVPAVELFLAASVFPIFLLPLPLSRAPGWWQRWRARRSLRRALPQSL